jgi:hypothetical protein
MLEPVPADEGDFLIELTRFTVMLTCYNCEKPDSRSLEGLPVDITNEDELLESGHLSKLKFVCPKCESPIGSITGIKAETVYEPL